MKRYLVIKRMPGREGLDYLGPLAKKRHVSIPIGPACNRKGCHCQPLQRILEVTGQRGDNFLLHEERR